MNATAGIVTLSWGGFRCRLEGFADPMAVLAEALDWLASARPEDGRGPVTARGLPPGIRREYRNGALILRPVDADVPQPPPTEQAPRSAPETSAPDPDLGTFLGAAGGWSSRAAPEAATPVLREPPTLEPASAQDLFRMGLHPDEAADPAPPSGRGPAPSEPPAAEAAPPGASSESVAHHKAVARLIRAHAEALRGERVPEATAAPRRARRVLRPSGAVS